MEEKPAELSVSPQEIQIQPPSFLDKIKIHKIKILGGVLGIFVFSGAVFGAYKFGQKQVKPGPGLTPTPVVVATPTPDPTVDWKTYRFEKSYKNGKLKFEMKYLQEWQVLEESESVKWYIRDPKEHLFFVSWLNPDFIYGVEGLCRFGMCDKISEIKTRGDTNIEIWKPTPKRREQLGLADDYLHATIVDLDKSIIPIFGTPSLKIELFKILLSTFKFLE